MFQCKQERRNTHRARGPSMLSCFSCFKADTNENGLVTNSLARMRKGKPVWLVSSLLQADHRGTHGIRVYCILPLETRGRVFKFRSRHGGICAFIVGLCCAVQVDASWQSDHAHFLTKCLQATLMYSKTRGITVFSVLYFVANVV
jgi:hypothetical protein